MLCARRENPTPATTTAVAVVAARRICEAITASLPFDNASLTKLPLAANMWPRATTADARYVISERGRSERCIRDVRAESPLFRPMSSSSANVLRDVATTKVQLANAVATGLQLITAFRLRCASARPAWRLPYWRLAILAHDNALAA